MMRHPRLFAAPLALVALAAPAAAQDAAPKEREARIAYPSMVTDFRADGRDVIYLRAGAKWYRGMFEAPCLRLSSAWQIAFRPAPGVGGIDRNASILVPREGECRLASLVRIDGKPPETAKKPSRPKG